MRVCCVIKIRPGNLNFTYLEDNSRKEMSWFLFYSKFANDLSSVRDQQYRFIRIYFKDLWHWRIIICVYTSRGDENIGGFIVQYMPVDMILQHMPF